MNLCLFIADGTRIQSGMKYWSERLCDFRNDSLPPPHPLSLHLKVGEGEGGGGGARRGKSCVCTVNIYII